jgi:hypothetical protein
MFPESQEMTCSDPTDVNSLLFMPVGRFLDERSENGDEEISGDLNSSIEHRHRRSDCDFLYNPYSSPVFFVEKRYHHIPFFPGCQH